MKWQQLLGHLQQYQWFRQAHVGQRLATSFLFVGPDGIGKRTFARLLAKSLLCQRTAHDELDFCGSCESCVQVEASTHPDLIELAKPEDKSELPVRLLIGEPESRMREGLIYDMSLRPFSGRRKIAIVDDADWLNEEGANALLKTLEEPPTDSVLILISQSLQRQLPTIRSRCQAVLFRPLPEEQLARLLLEASLVSDSQEAAHIAAASDGSLSIARQLCDADFRQYRAELYEQLLCRPLAMAALAKSCTEMVDAAGKEARQKRDRLKQILYFAGQLYRGLVRSHFQAGKVAQSMIAGDVLVADSVHRAVSTWTGGVAAALSCWQLCCRMIEQVDRNANQATLIQYWSAEIARHSGC
ncbi:MAG: AAA family ATPase [Pirellulaceae bacterium]|nr:AAA family ATPase [Pirellulaceae bacterium]